MNVCVYEVTTTQFPCDCVCARSVDTYNWSFNRMLFTSEPNKKAFS